MKRDLLAKIDDTASALEKAAKVVLREALEDAHVHPCDVQDDVIAARSLSEPLKKLLDALVGSPIAALVAAGRARNDVSPASDPVQDELSVLRGKLASAVAVLRKVDMTPLDRWYAEGLNVEVAQVLRDNEPDPVDSDTEIPG